MKQILLNVKQQKLFLPVNDYIVESSKNYLSLKFNFIDNDWSNCDIVIAVLENYDGKIFKEVLDNENCITVKKQILTGGYFKVCLRGYNSKIGQTIPTNSVDIPVNYTIYVGQEDLEETTFDQIGNSFVKARLDDYSRIIFTRNNGKELVVQINDTTYFKGEFTSLEQLIEKYPTGEVGEYAYVNTTLEDGDYLIKYTWDADSNSWKEYSTDKYVTSSSFALFKNNLNAQLQGIEKSISAVFEVEVENLDKDSVEKALKGFSMDKQLALFLHEHNNVIIRVKIRNKMQNFLLGICNFKKSASLCEVFDPQVDNGKFSWMFKFNFTGFVDIAEERYEIIFSGGENQNFTVTFTRRLLALVDGSYGDYTLWGVEKKLNDKIEEKQQKLIVGENIEIGDDGTISAIGGGVEHVEELLPPTIPDPENTTEGPVSVPTSGYVEKVYLNTNLTDDEVLAEIAKLPAPSDINDALTELGVPILNTFSDIANMQTEEGIYLAYIKYTTSDGVELAFIADTIKYLITEDQSALYWISPNYAQLESNPMPFTGWNPDFNGEIQINAEVVNPLPAAALEVDFGITEIAVGEHNEDIVNLAYVIGEVIATKPNPAIDPAIIYCVKTPTTPVPNNGYIEKVYFNTDLSEEEVLAELEKLTYLDALPMNILLFKPDQSMILAVMKQDTMVTIADFVTQAYYWVNSDASTNMQLSFVGWNPDFNGELEINSEVVSEVSGLGCGTGNDKIALLFSTTQNFVGGFAYYNYSPKLGEYIKLLTDKDKVDIDFDSIKIEVDEEMSDESTNPVQNKVVKKYIDNIAQKKLTAGEGITITEDGTISISYPLAEEEEY